MTDDVDVKRRDALQKLAKLTAYSTPSVIALLTPQHSYAQTSEAVSNPSNQNKPQVSRCVAGNRSNINGNLGNNSGGQTNDPSDCPAYHNS